MLLDDSSLAIEQPDDLLPKQIGNNTRKARSAGFPSVSLAHIQMNDDANHQVTLTKSNTPQWAFPHTDHGLAEPTLAGENLRATSGVMMSSPAENGYWDDARIVTADRSSSLSDSTAIMLNAVNAYNGVDTPACMSIAYFPFDEGWLAGHAVADSNGDYYETPESKGSVISNGWWGESEVTIPGGNSELGMLFVVGAGDDYYGYRENDNTVTTGALDTDTWHVVVREHHQDWDEVVHEDYSYVYLPFNSPHLGAGADVAPDGSILTSGGSSNFQLTRQWEGSYRLSIDDYHPDDGILFVTIFEESYYNGWELPQDYLISYAVEGDEFVIQATNMPYYSSTADAGFVFAFLPFDAVQPDIPETLSTLPFLQPDWETKRNGASPGTFVETTRSPRTLMVDERINMPTVVADNSPEESGNDPDIDHIPMGPSLKTFEFYNLASGRTFRWQISRQDLRDASLAVSDGVANGLSDPGNPPVEGMIGEDGLDGEVQKSWSDGVDSRTRRALADGWPDNDSRYQNIGTYGGCTATVLDADESSMVAITAAHCIFSAQGVFTGGAIRPRRDRGNVSPQWGTWDVVDYGYFQEYIDWQCEVDGEWGDDCINVDIAILIAQPRSNVAAIPNGLGWAQLPKDITKSSTKFMRGYPSCGDGHSPRNAENVCFTNTLYGSPSFSTKYFRDKDSDGWWMHTRHSSDLNPGDSGAPLYTEYDGSNVVFAVQSSEDTCYSSCSSHYPNYARRITPQFFDLINSVID